MSRHNFSISLPDWMSSVLRKAKHAILPVPKQEAIITLSGSRDIEWSYIASRLRMGPGYAFDFGCGFGNMCIHAVQKGYKVMALDLEPGPFPWTHPNVEIIRGDLLKLELPDQAFDYILNCSTVEDVEAERENADHDPMRSRRDNCALASRLREGKAPQTVERLCD